MHVFKPVPEHLRRENRPLGRHSKPFHLHRRDIVQRRVMRTGHLSNHGFRLRISHIHDDRHAVLDDPGFFARDLAERIPEAVHMVPADRGDHADKRLFDNVRAVAAAAKPYLEHDKVRLLLGKPHESDRGHHFEFRRGLLPGRDHFLRRADHAVSDALQRLITDVGAVHLHAFVEDFDERGDIHPRAVPCSPQHFVEVLADRAFAVRPRNVKDPKPLMRVSEPCQKAFHAGKPQFAAKFVVRADACNDIRHWCSLCIMTGARQRRAPRSFLKIRPCPGSPRGGR